MVPAWLFIVVLVFGGFWMAVALYAWDHAAKWSKLIAYSRIAVEYKGKVKIDASLREWSLWCREVGKEKGIQGHVMYVMGGTRIALFKGVKPAKIKPVKERGGPKQVRQGTWSASDETPKENRL